MATKSLRRLYALPRVVSTSSMLSSTSTKDPLDLVVRNVVAIETYTRFADTRRQYATTVQEKKPEVEDAKVKKMQRQFVESPTFGLNIFRGRIYAETLFPYPEGVDEEKREMLSMLIGPTEKFFEEVNKADKQDEQAKIDKDVLQKFAELGAFGCVVPPEYEGAGLNNTQMARMAEIIGYYDLAMGVTMGAHQSIGYKGILLYGTEEQKKKYLPDLATGRKFAAFALTEPGHGSDANSVKTRAELSKDGKHYVINGNKIWISNGGFADVFTVFAQTKVTKDGMTKDKLSAFIVERGFGGVTSGPPEKKMGIKGSNTTEVYFENVKVPKENLLGAEGEGFKVAMNILNNGRFGIPASMTGTMRFCIDKAVEHANNRVQFGNKLREYGDIRRKIAEMQMRQYVCESIVYMLAGNMDCGVQEFQIEAAIAKVLSSEYATWVCDEAIQILGGMGFMREPGLERFARDLRIFRIFEGTNDVLRLFVALTGMQYAGSALRQLQSEIKNANVGVALNEVRKRASRMMGLGVVADDLSGKVHSSLNESAKTLNECVDAFGACVEEMLIKHGKDVLHQQQKLRRIADAAIDIYAMAASLSRCTRSINANAPSADNERRIVKLFCQQAEERVKLNLKHCRDKKLTGLMDEMDWLGKTVLDNNDVLQQRALGL